MDSPGDELIRPGHESPPASSPCVGGKNHFSYFALSPGLALQPDRPICLRLTDGGGTQEGEMADGRGQPGVSCRDQTQQLGQEPPFFGCPKEGSSHWVPQRDMFPETTQQAHFRAEQTEMQKKWSFC